MDTEPVVTWLRDSLADAIGSWLWPAIWTLVVTASIAIWNFVKGRRGPWTFGLIGAAVGVGIVATTSVLLVWWGPMLFYSVGGAVLVSALIVGGARSLRARRDALNRYEKGYFEFKREDAKAQAGVAKALGKATGEMETIRRIAQRGTAGFDRAIKAGNQRKAERVANWVGRKLTKSAARITRYGLEYRRHHAAFMVAREGLIETMPEHTTPEEFQKLRDINVNTLGHLNTFKATVTGLPKMSQRMNMAKGTTADAISGVTDEMDQAVAFCDRSIRRLRP